MDVVLIMKGKINECEVCGLIPNTPLERIKDLRAGEVFRVCPLCREELRERNKLIIVNEVDG